MPHLLGRRSHTGDDALTDVHLSCSPPACRSILEQQVWGSLLKAGSGLWAGRNQEEEAGLVAGAHQTVQVHMAALQVLAILS